MPTPLPKPPLVPLLPSQMSGSDDSQMLKLAREISMDIRSVEDILISHEISSAQWDIIATHPSFVRYLRSCIEEWGSAVNTSERVRLKSLAFVEESLPEFYARAHDPKEGLAAKTEVLKAVARFAGVGIAAVSGVSGERMSVVINLGADHSLRIEKDITPTLTSEGNDE